MKTAVTFCISLFLFFLVPNGGRAQDSGGRYSFHFERLPLRAALDSLMRWFPESIVYLDDDVEGKTVSISCPQCDFERALNTLLNGTSLTWVKLGSQVIVKREGSPQPEVSATVSGTVTDSITGEWIAGASVLLQNTAEGTGKSAMRWCPTNDFGFFSLARVPVGTYVLTYRALGYETVTRVATITADRNLECNAGMRQKDITMQEVTVEGRRVAMTSVAGISRGVYLRSVPTDRNQYLLDGGRIYNPTHFGGVLSTFSPEVLNDVQVLEGGLPPSYGGRVGGFVDLSLRDGSRERLSGSAGAGTLGSTLSLGGPVFGNTTFLFSGRRGYPDAAMEFLHSGGNPSRQRFSELVGKVTHRLSGSGQISLSAYLGGDTYDNHVAEGGQRLNNDFSWDNAMLDLRWIGTVSPSLFLYASASYSQYGFDLQHSLSADSALTSVPGLSSNYGIEDFTIHVHAEDYYDEDHTVRAGAEVGHHRMHGTISAFSTQVAPFSMQNFSSWEATVYLQDQWRLLPGLTAELGGRATSFMGDEGTFSGVDPRFSLRASLDQQTFMYCSLSGINQFVHAYRNSGIFLLYPTVFWYPSTDTVRPSTSLLLSLGAQKTFDDEQYIVSVESYYRITNNLHEFGFDTTARFSPDLEASILFGTGRTYGMVFTFQRRMGNLTGSVTYNLSWSTEQFAGVNAGREFPSPFDRRHEVQVSARYALGGEWILGAVCALATGPSSLMSPKISAPSGYRSTPFAANAVAPYNEFLDINGGKLPGFQRLEFSAVRRFVAWGLPCQFTFRLLNSYGILDPFVWNLRRSSDIRTLWNVSLKEPSLVPLYPAVGLNVRF